MASSPTPLCANRAVPLLEVEYLKRGLQSSKENYNYTASRFLLIHGRCFPREELFTAALPIAPLLRATSHVRK
jgi:hypothetical protein